MIGAFDLAIVGSGFGGSLLAMIARRLGKTVLLIEKGRHPRVVIGESSTPMSNLMLEELTIRYDLPAIRPFAKWGPWQREHPKIACGLKRGFTFYHHNLESPQPPDPERGDQLLVEASPRDEIADTHWYRADVDRFFMEQACRMGAEYVDETALDGITFAGDLATLTGERRGLRHTWHAGSVVDATGPRGFLHRALGLAERTLPGLPETQALYSHFSGVGALKEEGAPYPVNAAAVHHVFDGGWIWVLQFNNGITSAGVAGRAAHESWDGLVARIPALRDQFAQAKAERPFARIPRLAFRSGSIAGANWALLPSAAGFVDPLFSTGFPLTLAGIVRLGLWLEGSGSLEAYERETDADLLAAGRLIAALYANMGDFRAFTALSMVYFAAVTYSETARRAGRPELAGSFLMRDREPFGTASAELLVRALRGGDFAQDVKRLIEPVNVAGLADERKRNWYRAL